MKNVIIGTAGHIDHGKTALVKALTEIDTDRFPEEKKRGLTIDIGFAFFYLSEEIRVNLIDVPGHERFIKNMLAGATTIAGALLVIAADDGVMPQTREHLEILELLNIEQIIVVITKCDLVDKDWLEMLEEEIHNLICKTRFMNARVVSVSAINNQGVDKLKTAMIDLISDISKSNDRITFRLPIDRVFTKPGFGCVVTGSVIGGKVDVDGEVELLPKKTVVRVRGIEVNGSKENSVSAGQRAAINLAGIKSSDVSRGCELAAAGILDPVSMVDCEFYLHSDAKKNLANRTRIRFHLFTSEIIGRVILLDKEVLRPGESGLVQIRLEKPVVVERNDRYILRSYSPAYTIGGGRVLRPNTRYLKRFKKEALKSLEILASNNVSNIIELIINESDLHYLPVKEIQKRINLPEQDTRDIIEDLVGKGKLFTFDGTRWPNMKLIHFKRLERLQRRAEEILEIFHKKEPLKPGMEETNLRSKIDKDLPGEMFSFLISKLSNDKKIRLADNKITLYNFNIKMADADKQKLQLIEDAVIKEGFSPSSKDELISKVSGEKIHNDSLFKYLVETGKLIEVSKDLFYHQDIIDQLADFISNHIRENSSISVAEFRDITNTSRKYAIPLLEYFDKVHFTKRKGDKRILF